MGYVGGDKHQSNSNGGVTIVSSLQMVEATFFSYEFSVAESVFMLPTFHRRSRFRLDNEKRIEIRFDEPASENPAVRLGRIKKQLK